jgi:hypothetical protein
MEISVPFVNVCTIGRKESVASAGASSVHVQMSVDFRVFKSLSFKERVLSVFARPKPDRLLLPNPTQNLGSSDHRGRSVMIANSGPASNTFRRILFPALSHSEQKDPPARRLLLG